MPLDITVNVSATGGSVATLSALGYAADLISVSTDVASGTIYYLLHNSVSPLSGSAIKAAVVGLTATGGGTLDPLDVDNQPVDWTGVTPATYWINMVQETAGGFSNVVSLEVTIISASFDPASLPGARIVVDVNDITTLWQNNNGTSQVTAADQFVGSVTNRGSLGGLFSNTGGSDEPQYKEVGGRKFLDFDGSNDFLTLTHGSDVNLSGGYWLWVVMYDDGTSASSSKAFGSFAAASPTGAYNSPNGLSLLMAEVASNPNAIRVRGGLDNTGGWTTQLVDSRTTSMPWAVMELECVPIAASPSAWLRIEKAGDGAPVEVGTADNSGGAAPIPDNTIAVRRFTLGADIVGAGLNGFGKSSIAAMVLVAGTLSTADRNSIRAWCRARAAL